MMESLCIGSALPTELLPALYGAHRASSRTREHILIVLYERHKDKSHHATLAKKGLLDLRLQIPARDGFLSMDGKSSN